MNLTLSRKAATDLRAIARYTTMNFGRSQSEKYRKQFNSCFSSLSNTPLSGRTYDHIRPGLRRFDLDHHVIFYMLRSNTILVVRILHKSQDAAKHL